MLTETSHAGEFLYAEANGTLSRERIVIASGEGVLKTGTVLGKLAGGKYAAYDNAASDGSQAAVGILYAGVDATSADADGVLIARHAEVVEAALTGLDAAGKTDLAAL
ncbi:head decoration protein, partial [Arthrospira platensis SPKY1]|nr:head decoration protein [Arthrospira platensis SPKY1]